MKFVSGLLVALLSQCAMGADRDFASLHQFNGSIQIRPKLRVVLHSRLRFDHNVSDFYQFRAGPILFWDWKPRLQWQAGYYLLEQRSSGDTVTIQRPWAGVQVRALDRGRLSVDWRNLLERHLLSGLTDFTRFRTRAMLNFQPKVGWQPYASAEALALRGHVIGRYTAGVNYATEGGHLFGFGYEFRQDVGRPGSHIIATMVQFRMFGGRGRQKPGATEVPQ